MRMRTSVVRPGMSLIHLPTGREVQVIEVEEEYFEVICIPDGARWRLALEDIKEFCLLY